MSRRRWVWVDGEGLVEDHLARRRDPPRIKDTLMPDLVEPVKSTVDGTILRSRADIREHNRRNGVEDIGNDPSFLRPRKPIPMPDIGPDIARALRRRD